MKRHIILLVVGLLVFALLLMGAKSLDGRITMPLLQGGPAESSSPVVDFSEDNGATSVSSAGLSAVQQAAAVDDLIAAIPSPVSLGDEAAIAAARAAYDALDNDAKALVGNLATLQAAETELAELKSADNSVAESTPVPDAEPTSQPDAESDPASSQPQADTPGELIEGLQAGDTVTFIGGNVYVSSDAAAASRNIPGSSTCTVTHVAPGAVHPYHLVSQDGGGVYGWVDAASMKEA